MKEETFWKALLHAIKWLPFLILFFGGISLNCAKALLCHAFSINIEWASTAKEMGPTGFYIGLDKMVQSFKYTWLICLLLSGGESPIFSLPSLFWALADHKCSHDLLRCWRTVGLDHRSWPSLDGYYSYYPASHPDLQRVLFAPWTRLELSILVVLFIFPFSGYVDFKVGSRKFLE